MILKDKSKPVLVTGANGYVGSWITKELLDNNYNFLKFIRMKNIFGEPLKSCCNNPITGYFRDGYCRTDKYDFGKHVVCAIVTKEFLKFSKERGNDLSTPQEQYFFPGLKEGDKWCLCVLRWKEALDAGCAPKVDLESTNEKALKYVKIEDFIEHSYKVK